VKTRVEILKSSGATRRVFAGHAHQQDAVPEDSRRQFQSRGRHREDRRGKTDALGIITAEFPAGVKPVLTLTSRVATKNYVVDLSEPGKARKADRADLEHFLRPTKLLPTDGILRAMATEVTNGSKADLEKARAIYEWIVDNAFRTPKTRGCGRGDIRFMLESKDLGGKCADLNALFVGLARAALPVRDVYGIRVANSELGYKSLGTSAENISIAQHCRAEVYIPSHGWVPVDPADVRKVVLEEPPGNRPLSDEMVKKARAPVRFLGDELDGL
jgi:transglutaminase-like putative cysteine protease